MTTKKARDFLDKELFVKRDIVTFRSLSRELGIHVKDAKNELQVYYDAVRGTDAPAVPTYLVSGEVPALTVNQPSATQQSSSTMDLDLEFEEDRVETELIPQTNVLLVDAGTLEEAKSQFSCVHSVHIYSLSPSRFRDAGLVCTPSFKVHEADIKGGPEFFTVVGKITGPHVKLGAGSVAQSAASSSKSTLDVPAKAAPKPLVKAEPQTMKNSLKAPSGTKELAPKVASLSRTESKDKPKPSGKLDWSKAKTKEKGSVAERTKEEKKPKVEPDSPIARGILSGDAQKRGMKRKPTINKALESESEPSSAKDKPIAAVGSSVKKGVVYSDGDDDDDDDVRMLGQRRLKRKSATVTSDSEMSLRAMMDIEDEQVERVPRVCRVLPKREEEESEEEENEPETQMTAPPATTEEEESDHIPVVPKRRKPRKVVPVGRNGLKKRRVLKSRTTTDAKGYMQTEDYSSYESVEEEEEEVKAKPKGKRRETKKALESTDGAEAKPKVVKEEVVAKPKAKQSIKSRGGAPGRGGLLNFFGPERGKK